MRLDGAGRSLAWGVFTGRMERSLPARSTQLRLKTLPTLHPPTRCKFFSLTETPEDYTLMVDEEGFKGGGWAEEGCRAPLCGILTRYWSPVSQVPRP